MYINILNKGDSKKPECYRPITILSTLGKLFTSVLNNRITLYLESNNLLHENQAGFRKYYSCSDHIFTLHALIEILKKKKQKLFCAYVDFSAAFDKVWRIGLWQKLIKTNINGKIFNVIFNMYQNIKSRITHLGEFSDSFCSNTGVRQGENLSPVLFSIFLNDLQEYLESQGSVGIELTDTLDAEYWLKLLVLLYADDTVIISNSKIDFQNTLLHFNQFCEQWHLNINTNKTKVVIFGARNVRNFQFHIGESNLEITEKYLYLGITFSSNGSFLQARKHIVQQAKKGLYLLLTKVNNSSLPFDLILKLFDHTVLPILMYGSEIFGYESLEIIEKVQCEFLRKITSARKSTPKYMLFGETGVIPISIMIKNRMISFWNRLVTGKVSKLSYKIYQYMLKQPEKDFKWLRHIKTILESSGRADVWLLQPALNTPNLGNSIKQILIDQYYQEWNTQLQSSNKGRTYAVYKETHSIEKYLIRLPKYEREIMFKFRTNNTHFPEETGRWDGTSPENRRCVLCSENAIGNSKHYLLRCEKFKEQRQNILQTFCLENNDLNFKRIVNIQSENDLKILCKFLSILLKHVR